MEHFRKLDPEQAERVEHIVEQFREEHKPYFQELPAPRWQAAYEHMLNCLAANHIQGRRMVGEAPLPWITLSINKFYTPNGVEDYSNAETSARYQEIPDIVDLETHMRNYHPDATVQVETCEFTALNSIHYSHVGLILEEWVAMTKGAKKDLQPFLKRIEGLEGTLSKLSERHADARSTCSRLEERLRDTSLTLSTQLQRIQSAGFFNRLCYLFGGKL